VDGDWLHILGRDSETIIVGGEKVSPQEVEDTILVMDGIEEVLVRGEPHPMIGQMVVALVKADKTKDRKKLQKAIRGHCRKHLEPYKVPIKIALVEHSLTNERQKKVRD